jgi:lipoprotein-anchoring transpeptidase ErfK/SrfK
MKSPYQIALALSCAALLFVGCQRTQSSQTSLTEPVVAQAQTVSASESAASSEAAAPIEPTMLPGPNAVPKDTRIVVNIPAFRMDVFKDGTLLKSYKIGIGYVEYPLPRGLRKAEMIIFNPTWTQPNEPWASNPGEVVAAGTPGNPLGPIKVPIGGANLIHGGKSLAKIGTFASHGCVGLTNGQVKDFAQVLADATQTELSAGTMAAYLKRPTRTQVVKLKQVVPVELRYQTITVEDGKLHIYRDVYNQKTNTEENLRLVLEGNGLSWDKLSEEEKSRVSEILNIVTGRRTKQPPPAPLPANATAADRAAANAARKAEALRQRKLRSQKEFVTEIAALAAKGYPAAVNLNSGAREVTTTTNVEVNREVSPSPRPSPTNRVVRPRPVASPSPVTPQPLASPTNPAVTPLPRTNPTPAPR